MTNATHERLGKYEWVVVVAVGTLLATLALVLTLMPESAEASFPANNGKIAFLSDRDDPNNSDIYVMKADGSEVRRLTNSPAPSHERHPAFSPDGTRIAFDRNDEIWVMNANGTNQTQLTTHGFTDQRPAWSPDGTRIAFESDREFQLEIYVMDAVDTNNDGNGDNLRRLTTNPANDRKPDFSPSGARIAFHSDRDEGSGVEIYTMDTADTNNDGNGDNLKRLTTSPGNDAFSSYSPTGVRIAFASPRTSPAGSFQEIYVMDAVDRDNDGEGDDLTRLVAGFGTNPSWSPDGTGIAFSGDVTNSDIFRVSADGGGTPTNLTDTADPIFEAWPSWGPRPSDTTPPQTTLDTSGPSGTVTSTSATFTFSSESNAAFDCKLDGGPFELCSSPKTYTDLPSGDHTFQVRAADTSGNTDPDPASRTWTVDVTDPTVSATTTKMRSGNATVQFSEPMDASTLMDDTTDPVSQPSTSQTIVLLKGAFTSTTVVPAKVSCTDDSCKTVTLDPDVRLGKFKKYTVKVEGEADIEAVGDTLAVEDLQANKLAQDYTKSFKTGAR